MSTNADLHADEAHPGYEYKTTSGPRKGWNVDESRPMSDPGEPPWERNTHRGEDGWYRFPEHEEAYWMRRKPLVSPDLVPDLTACEEQRDVYRERVQLLAGRVAEMRSALRALIARVRRTGGYASPEEQQALREAERVLAEERE